MHMYVGFLSFRAARATFARGTGKRGWSTRPLMNGCAAVEPAGSVISKSLLSVRQHQGQGMLGLGCNVRQRRRCVRCDAALRGLKETLIRGLKETDFYSRLKCSSPATFGFAAG